MTFNLLVNDDDEEAAEPLEPVRLVEPTLSAVDSAFDSLLQSGPPTLLAPVSVQVPAGGDDDDNAPQHDPVVLLEPSGSEVAPKSCPKLALVTRAFALLCVLKKGYLTRVPHNGTSQQ